jgi:hypothetical protein
MRPSRRLTGKHSSGGGYQTGTTAVPPRLKTGYFVVIREAGRLSRFKLSGGSSEATTARVRA